MMRHLILGTAMALALAACSNETANHDAASDTAVAEQVKAASLGTFGVALDHMDTSVDPGDNFFEYVNGAWLRDTEIPADRSRYGAFNFLSDDAEAHVREIIQDAAAKDNPSVDEKRIGDLFAAFTDTDTIEAKGLAPIEGAMAQIRAAQSHTDAAKLMMDAGLGLSSPVSSYVWIDAKDNDNYIIYLTQSGLGLPTRDYYFNEGERDDAIRASYVDFLDAMLTAAGEDNSRARAEAVMAFETDLAEGYWTRVEQRDRDKTYNKVTYDELKSLAPGLPWDEMMAVANVPAQDAFIAREITAIEHGAKVFADADMGVLRDYMMVNLLSNNSAYLPASVDEARFAFYGKTLRGQETQRERWKRGVEQVNSRMGELVGKVYVKKHFPPESKTQMQDLVENLRDAFEVGIDGLEWMGEETKEQAQYKLAKFRPKIGYPDEFETYEGLDIDRDDLMGSVMSAREWAQQDDLSKLGGPIDREEWGMTPQRVNAYYNSTLNEIVFPAAILQAPFFDPNADPAVNYGGIGAVIGHEMGHGFDDQGRKSDGDGLQRDWWTEADAEAYTARADALAAQYSAFEPLPGENLDGYLGLGENIGDLTGVTMAYEAYKKSLNGKEAPVIDGFTGDQRFFMAWAQVWAIKWRDEALSAQIKNGPHSPGEFRANGIVRNHDAWYEAFDVGRDDAMYIAPEKRVKIW